MEPKPQLQNGSHQNADPKGLQSIESICDYSKQTLYNACQSFFESIQKGLNQLSSQDQTPNQCIFPSQVINLKKQPPLFLQGFACEWEQQVQNIRYKLDNSDELDLSSWQLVDHQYLEQEIQEKKFIHDFKEAQDSLVKTLLSGLEQVSPNSPIHLNNLPFLPLGLARCIQQGFRNTHFDSAQHSYIEQQMTTLFLPKVQTLYWGIKRHLENKGINLDTYELQRHAPQTNKPSHPLQETSHSQPPQSTPPPLQPVTEHQSETPTTREAHETSLSLRQLLNSIPTLTPFTKSTIPTPTASTPTISNANANNVHPIQSSPSAILSNTQIERLLAELSPEQSSSSETLQHALQQKLAASTTTGATPQLNQPGENYLNLVSMLFEFVKGDQTWIPAVESLLAQLQLSYMRLALLDDQIFDQAAHPARLMLNDATELAETITTTESENYDVFKDAISSVLALKTVSANAFKAPQQRIRQFIESQLKPKAQKQESKVKAASAAKALEDQLQKEAQEAVQSLVVTPISDIKSPLAIHVLIEKIWSQIIYETYLKFSGTSKEKRHACALLNTLLWSTGASDEPVTKEKLQRLLPNLLKGITHAITHCNIDDTLKSRFFEELNRIHLLFLEPDKNSAEALDNCSIATTTLANEVGCALQKTQANIAKTAAETEASERKTAEAMGIGHHDNHPAQSEMRYVRSFDERRSPRPSADIINLKQKRGSSADKPDATHSNKIKNSKEALKILLTIESGTWLNYQINGELKHCKVTFYSSVLGKYTFIDRMGNKLFDRKRDDLLLDIQNGYASVIEQHNTFDRALESIVSNIRSCAEAC